MNLLEALVNQGYEKAEAKEIINELKTLIMEGEDPEELLFEYGLEPDYIMDLLY